MLPNDGSFTIFCVEYQWKKKGKWSGAGDCDNFLADIPRKYRGNPYGALTACGRCWQETCIHGTYNLPTANRMVRKLRKHTSEHKFRVVKVRISQETIPITTT